MCEIKRKYWGIALLLVFSLSQIQAQKQTHFNTINKSLDNYTNILAPEKVYLQTDKDFYSKGDTIWFKAYLVDGIRHFASDKSNIVHVEFLSPNDSIVVKRQLFTNKGSAFGDITIDDSFEEGDYSIRAYTIYMLNDSEPIFFKKKISILTPQITTNTIRNKTAPVDTKIEENLNKDILVSEKIDIRVQFFPEGGDFVTDLQSQMGVKTTDELGNGIALKGKIIDQEGNVVNSFQTFDFGLGIATITPKTTKKYYAEISIDGLKYKYPIPAALEKGYVLQVKNQGSKITLKVSSNIVQGLKGALLLGHLRGETFLKHTIDIDQDFFIISLPTSTISNGVAHFTLFSPKGEPVCERLTFIENPDNEVDFKFRMNKTDYSFRENVEIEMSLFNTLGKPLQGDLSISVALDNSLSKGIPNIRSWLLLNSDMGNTIKNPNYYFEENSKTSKHVLDALMLTHGWRRFVWKSFLTDNLNKVAEFPPEKGIMIHGRTLSLGNGYRSNKTFTTLSFLGQDIYQEKVMTDNQGKFSFGPFIFKDSIRAVINASATLQNYDSDEDIAIYLDKLIPKENRNKASGPKPQEVIDITEKELKMEYRNKITDYKYLQRVTSLEEVIV
tara:strand:+ start:99 stop:1937 length:1839 start_codon:yes stop_codon:yes gene_type:complete